MTVDEACNLIEQLNDEAHGFAWDLWVEASDADDEEMREEASEVQQSHFRKLFKELDPGTQVDIVQLCLKNEDLNEQFDTYHGEED
jgi:hypothetical protein